MRKILSTYFLGGICGLITLLVVFFLASISDNNIRIKIDGAERIVEIEDNTFEQICKDTSGFWMAEGMGELRNGVSVSIEKCSGCMPNSNTMFCQLDNYLAHIKKNGVDTTNFNIGG